MSDWIKCHESVHEEIWRKAQASRDAEVESMRKNFQDKEMADLMETGRLKLELAALTKECAGLYADSDKLQKALYTMESEVARLTAALESLPVAQGVDREKATKAIPESWFHAGEGYFFKLKENGDVVLTRTIDATLPEWGTGLFTFVIQQHTWLSIVEQMTKDFDVHFGRFDGPKDERDRWEKLKEFAELDWEGDIAPGLLRAKMSELEAADRAATKAEGEGK